MANSAHAHAILPSCLARVNLPASKESSDFTEKIQMQVKLKYLVLPWCQTIEGFLILIARLIWQVIQFSVGQW